MNAAGDPPAKIASLLASGTELVCALGLGDRLVARSHECDFPAWVKRLPAVSRPTFDIGGSSADIDARVRERLRAGAPLYEVDDALLASLAPDVIVTQTHCEVCAVSPGDLAHGAAGDAGTTAGRGAGIRHDRRHPRRLSERRGRARRGRRGRARWSRASARASRRWPAGRVPCPLRGRRWRASSGSIPLFAMGNWGPELIALAGGACVLGTAGAHSTTLPWQALRDADPEVIVVAPCGFGLERTLAEMPTLAAQPGWSELRAVRAGRVYVADGNLYFNRSGPLLFDTPEILAEILHPTAFAPAHEGAVWRRWPVVA